MIYLLIFTIIALIINMVFEPFIDSFDDYRGEHHIILWYNHKGKRKFINLIGNQ